MNEWETTMSGVAQLDFQFLDFLYRSGHYEEGKCVVNGVVMLECGENIRVQQQLNAMNGWLPFPAANIKCRLARFRFLVFGILIHFHR